MNINAQVIPARKQRYPTVGDYFLKRGTWQFRVSDMKNEDYEFLVLIHELVEWHLTQKRGITEEAISAFDRAFEAKRSAKLVTLAERGCTEAELQRVLSQEPGNAAKAPYKREHRFATLIEKLVAQELGVSWKEYSRTVNNL